MFPAPPEKDGVAQIDVSFKGGGIGDGYPVWTENKAKLIQLYVRFFILITKHGTYIDGFAGPQVEFYNDDSWAAKRVLEIEPRWLRRFILSDLAGAQVQHLQQLREDRAQAGDKRAIEVRQGDFNQLVDSILVPGAIREKEATFCLLDQRTFECKWATVRKIAQYKPGPKIEQFYFLPVGWLARSIHALKDEAVLREWWGGPDTALLQSCRSSHDYAKLFVARFKEELGYGSAVAWPILSRGDEGRIMFYMIHASDHPEAHKLMWRAYRQATNAAQPMEQLQAELDGFELSGWTADERDTASAVAAPSRPEKKPRKTGKKPA
jgi:three-Cys-motif partner protein